MEKEPLYIEVSIKYQRFQESIVLSSSGKILHLTKEHTYSLGLSRDETCAVIYQNRDYNDLENMLAYYSPEKDSLLWVHSQAELSALTSEEIYYHHSGGDSSSVRTLTGDQILSFSPQSYLSVFRLNDHQLLYTLENQRKYSVYNQHFDLLCDSCYLNSLFESESIFIFFRTPQTSVFELVNERLVPITDKRYRAVLGGSKMIALLTENNEIEYLPLEN
jgi:hypothetical protein